MKTSHFKLLAILVSGLLALAGLAQANSGSDWQDGALNPTSNLVTDMADHPDGVYHCTSVNTPTDATARFLPNAADKPVVWLVQGDCTIARTVDVSGQATLFRAPAGERHRGGFGLFSHSDIRHHAHR